ncbi:dihydrofolate reductase family protein [Antrihabitans sp. YC2-6]|uniref:dihydrofolate reductase family protein n=1 Tax=Antrihabitans sp. YC2-6 TaxID=2799498 RepID=UPI0018F468F1|nr:dihydrofolate reductase family protein [Antrihabitans sp. YC2-6]MBJ8348296.1 dihydrofolate reductase family protein [Antrihabitans sp. YC2-6]
MGRVVMSAVMSLDGFIADPHDRVGPMFDWYGNGDVATAPGDPERTFHVSRASADYMNETWPQVGAAVIGRHLFDLTNGWHGRPAAGGAVFVVTHDAPTDWLFPDAPFTFVTDGVRSAIEQAKVFAGDRDVSISAGNVGAQAFSAGLVDMVDIDLVPVVLGAGKRFFGDVVTDQTVLENPRVVEGDRVIHLRYPVRAG